MNGSTSNPAARLTASGEHITDDSRELVKQYKALTAERWGGNVTLMGRLATHTYIDMDQAVNAALVAIDSLLKRLEL